MVFHTGLPLPPCMRKYIQSSEECRNAHSSPYSHRFHQAHRLRTPSSSGARAAGRRETVRRAVWAAGAAGAVGRAHMVVSRGPIPTTPNHVGCWRSSLPLQSLFALTAVEAMTVVVVVVCEYWYWGAWLVLGCVSTAPWNSVGTVWREFARVFCRIITPMFLGMLSAMSQGTSTA